MLIQLLPVFLKSFTITVVLFVPEQLFKVTLGENSARVVVFLLWTRADWLRGLKLLLMLIIEARCQELLLTHIPVVKALSSLLIHQAVLLFSMKLLKVDLDFGKFSLLGVVLIFSRKSLPAHHLLVVLLALWKVEK